MKRTVRRLALRADTLRQLSAAEFQIAGGLQFSNPVASCDSCTNCTCKPPA